MIEYGIALVYGIWYKEFWSLCTQGVNTQTWKNILNYHYNPLVYLHLTQHIFYTKLPFVEHLKFNYHVKKLTRHLPTARPLTNSSNHRDSQTW